MDGIKEQAKPESSQAAQAEREILEVRDQAHELRKAVAAQKLNGTCRNRITDVFLTQAGGRA